MNIKEQHKLSGIKIKRDKSTACIITTVQYKRQTKFQKYFRSKNKTTEVWYITMLKKNKRITKESNAVLCTSAFIKQLYCS